MPVLQNASNVGKYTVQNLIKANYYTETYRAVDEDNNPYFLKLFVLNNLPDKLMNRELGIVREIEYCKQMSHRNIVSYIDSGKIELQEGICQYYITKYFDGQILSDLVSQKGKLDQADAVAIFRGLLKGLEYMHSLSPVLCHNDLDPSNVILLNTVKNEPEIIDLGHVSERCSGSVPFDVANIDILYHANENMVGIYDEQSDVFSVCAILYYMLSGRAPWEMTFEDNQPVKDRFYALTQYRKRNPLDFSELDISEKIKHILRGGLALKYTDRLNSIGEIIQMLDSSDPVPSELEQKSSSKYEPSDNKAPEQAQSPNAVKFDIKRGSGQGFKDIAGMQELKDLLTQKVIFVIKNKDIAEEYKLVPPNGMLLYGPPGCGKTYFAEKFAEETGFNFLLIKSSDLASSFLHGSQEKIGQLFRQAAENAPIVLCFDEFDALVPDRSAPGSSYVSGEVNEFLSQMNNCSKRGIFIVATSNRPDKIDPAILRTGRIDKLVYVPLPDFEARKELFKLYLNNRPLMEDIDFEKLANDTEGYIASDIAYIVNDSAMTAAFARTRISNSLLQDAVHNTQPSVRKESLQLYQDIKERMEATGRRSLVGRPSIGFV